MQSERSGTDFLTNTSEENIVYGLDVAGDAADAMEELHFPSNFWADFMGGAVGEHLGREIGLPEGTGARVGVLIVEELTEDPFPSAL